MTNLLKMQWRELNAGRTGPEGKLVSRGPGYALFLTPAEMVFGFVISPPRKKSLVLRMTPLGEVIPHGVVLHAPVVPERDGALLPAEAAVELRRLDVAEEELQHGIALRARHLHDARGESAVHEEGLPARYRMRADDRMLRLGEDLVLLLHAVAAAVHVLALVQ